MAKLILAPRRHSTTAELLRLLAAYLAAVLVLQGVAAAFALGRGPVHSHRNNDGMAVSAASLLFSHHGHPHRSGERHFHAAADTSVVASASPGESIDALAFALIAALALMAVGSTVLGADPRRHVWRAAPGWAWRAGLPGFLFKPPRMG